MKERLPAIVFRGLHHASLMVANVEVSLQFYCQTLGLDPDPARSEMAFPGAWLNIGRGQQIHLLQLPNPDSIKGRPEHGGRDRHTALWVGNLGTLELHLKDAAIPYAKSRSGRAAIFCRDPDGNAIEFIQSI